jgi:hypothetical protein
MMDIQRKIVLQAPAASFDEARTPAGTGLARAPRLVWVWQVDAQMRLVGRWSCVDGAANEEG